MSHKHCCKPEQKPTKKGSANSFLITIGVITALLLGVVVYAGLNNGATTQVLADSQVSLAVAETNYDWGTIDYDGGVVSKSFEITNTSDSVLKLYDVNTSCMCTTAQLVSGNKKTKKFGMHEKNSSVFEVAPRESAELIAEFDPAFHGPSGVGPIDRTVTLNTNDSNHSNLSFQVKGNVVKK